ncbi:MAG: hypothetical protein Q4B26_10400 [Eubacteriales bacterium]|nr:hypothetical protein [Eubacteriales bacterium]
MARRAESNKKDDRKLGIEISERKHVHFLNSEHKKMLDWMKHVKFKKTLVGGISEQDMWKKLEELNVMYEASLTAERARYDALLKACLESDEIIGEYEDLLTAERAGKQVSGKRHAGF